MRREGWLYALAFLAIVGVGTLIILPRLDRVRGGASPSTDGDARRRTPAAAPREAGPDIDAFAGRPEYGWVRVTVSGVRGGLRGPLRGVAGAVVEAESPEDAPVQVLRLQPRASHVALGAVGHQWVRLAAAELAEGLHVRLPLAAPPIVVRVRELDGRPAAGVPLRIEPAAPGDPLRTDDGGTVVLDHLAPGLVTVDCTTDERAGPRLRLRAGEDRSVRVVLDPAWQVSGRVLDRGGAPLQGASVTAFGPDGVAGRIVSSDAGGAFTWEGPAIARLALRVRASGWAERAVEAAPPATGALHTELGEIRLESKGVVLVGRVSAAELQPGAHVTVEPAVAALLREVFAPGQVLDRPRTVPLDAEGRFRLHDLAANLPLRVAVRGAGVPVDAIVRGAPGEEVTVELAPPAGERFVGVLRTPDGAPAAGVRLLLSDAPRDGDQTHAGDIEVVTGADGSFARRGLAARTWFLRAYAARCRSLLQRVDLPLREPLALAFEAEVTDLARRVHGHVYDGVRTEVKTKGDDPLVGDATDVRYGRPLAGVTVRAAGVEGVTDAEGAFVLDGVESPAASVALGWGFVPGTGGAEDPRAYLAAGTLDVTPGGKPLDLVLWRSASLRFRAVDAIDDTPLAFVHVVVRTDRGRTVVDRGIAPRDGLVELHGLPSRGLALTVLAHGRRFARQPIPMRPGETSDLGDVLLRHGMRIEGRVFGPGGRPVPGARVGAYGKGWQQAGQDPGAERELLFRRAVSDLNGRFAIEGFDRRYPADLAIWAHGLAPTASRVSLPGSEGGMTAEVEVHLVEGGYLALDLRGVGTRRAPGRRVRGALVDVEFARDGSDWLDLLHHGLLGGPVAATERWRAASEQLLYERRGADGYVIGPLRPGPYTLWVERPGYEALRSKLTVIDPKQTVLVDVTSGRERKFRGRVTRVQFELEPTR